MGSSRATSTTRASSRARPARPACCQNEARVPGKPATTTASRPAMSTPSSRALVVATPEEVTAGQRRLQRPPLLGEVAAAVGGHPLHQLGVDVGEEPLRARARPPRRRGGSARTRACGPPRPPGRRACARPPCPRAAAPGAPFSPMSSGSSGGSHRARVRPALGDPSSLTATTGRPVRRDGEVGRVRHGGRGEHQRRCGAVPRADPQQPPQQQGDVRAEHPAVGVALVDDDVAQPAQERRPAGVPGQHGAVQHVRVAEHPAGVPAGPVALVERGVAVAARPAARPGGRARRGRASWSAASALVGERYRAVARGSAASAVSTGSW